MEAEEIGALARDLRDELGGGDWDCTRAAAAVVAALSRLANGQDPLGAAMRSELTTTTALSSPMVEWGLTTSLASFDEARLAMLAGRARANGRVGAALVAVVLAGNVFTAALRALLLPLSVGAPVLARVSSRDDVLPRHLKTALDSAAPWLGARLVLLNFDHRDAAGLAALLKEATTVSVYGNDATQQAISQRVPAGVRLLSHGHGLGAAYLPGSCLKNETDSRKVAEQVAMDVAAYDQRGCLSPHVVYVQSTARVNAGRFATLLAQALDTIGGHLPRGSLTAQAGAEQMQWRGVAAARGTLLAGAAHAVSVEGRLPVRTSPGWRNVGVYECEGPAGLSEALEGLGPHLKALGVGGNVTAQQQVRDALAAELEPRLSNLGQMQTPPLGALSDGRDPFEALTVPG